MNRIVVVSALLNLSLFAFANGALARGGGSPYIYIEPRNPGTWYGDTGVPGAEVTGRIDLRTYQEPRNPALWYGDSGKETSAGQKYAGANYVGQNGNQIQHGDGQAGVYANMTYTWPVKPCPQPVRPTTSR